MKKGRIINILIKVFLIVSIIYINYVVIESTGGRLDDDVEFNFRIFVIGLITLALIVGVLTKNWVKRKED